MPLFRYGKIQRIDLLVEFQLDRQHLADMPSKTSGQHALRAVLQGLKPLLATIERLLSNTRTVTGTVSIRSSSAIVKPENVEVLAAIKAHHRLKGYLDTEALAGYLLIKPRSHPHECIRRCQELGLMVTSLEVLRTAHWPYPVSLIKIMTVRSTGWAHGTVSSRQSLYCSKRPYDSGGSP